MDEMSDTGETCRAGTHRFTGSTGGLQEMVVGVVSCFNAVYEQVTFFYKEKHNIYLLFNHIQYIQTSNTQTYV